MDNHHINTKHDMLPDLIWGLPGIYQQILFSLLTIFIWAGATVLGITNPVKYVKITHWQQRVMESVHLDNVLTYLLIAFLLALGLSLAFLIFEMIWAFFSKEDWLERISQNDYLLPVTSLQKKKALGIVITASVLEEILFRAYLLFALLPLWNSWIWAGFIISAFFALVHTNLQGLSASIWIFLLSLLFIFLLIQTESLLFIIFIHLFLNIINIFILPVYTRKLVS